MYELLKLLIEQIGLSKESAVAFVDQYGQLAVQWDTMYCLWMMDQGKVHTPPAWFTAPLKHKWCAPSGMSSEWLPKVLNFRVDEETFMRIEREMREEAKEERERICERLRVTK
jgi:hypothetical protein